MSKQSDEKRNEIGNLVSGGTIQPRRYLILITKDGTLPEHQKANAVFVQEPQISKVAVMNRLEQSGFRLLLVTPHHSVLRWKRDED